MRFKVTEGSRSGHCCFNWSVVDTTKPAMFGPDYYRDSGTGAVQYEATCECFHEAHAKMIADALNLAFPGEKRRRDAHVNLVKRA
jgi:hypothetical protein